MKIEIESTVITRLAKFVVLLVAFIALCAILYYIDYRDGWGGISFTYPVLVMVVLIIVSCEMIRMFEKWRWLSDRHFVLLASLVNLCYFSLKLNSLYGHMDDLNIAPLLIGSIILRQLVCLGLCLGLLRLRAAWATRKNPA